MKPEQFREAGHKIIDWIADYREKVSDYPVVAQVSPGEIRSSLPAAPPEKAEAFDSILEDLSRVVLPGVTHWNHPNYYAYFPSNASLASVLGDLLSSGIGGIGLNWEANPALTEMEELVCDWMRQMLGLSPAWEGVIQDTASTSTLVALLCARERTTNHGQVRGGLQGEASPLVVYCSEQSHSSVKKAALLAGFGLQNVGSIETDDHFALRSDRLESAIRADRGAGKTPCAIVATTGTTATTALDPVAESAELADKYGLWLHVDSAMAGSAMILPECRWMWEGVESADSIVVNPHKWLGAVFDCSLYLVREPEHLVRVMSTNPSYLQTATDDEVRNFRDWGIPLGRRFRALKLWCLIRDQGVAGLQSRLRRDLENAQWLVERIDATDDWQRLAPVPLQTVCVRHMPPGLNAGDLDQHTLAWVEQINRSGSAYLTPAKLNGHWMVRISIGAESTTIAHVRELWENLKAAAASAQNAA